MEQAVVRAASRMAFHIGKGDLPLMMSNPLMRLMLQFKSFGLTAPGPRLTPMAQGLARGDFKAMQGVGSALTLGGIAYYFKELAAGNNTPDLSPGGSPVKRSTSRGSSAYCRISTTRSRQWRACRPSTSQRTIPEALLGPAAGTLGSLGERSITCAPAERQRRTSIGCGSCCLCRMSGF